ncbi:hypothetical protein BT67DRAFT_8088 [Trichocladium antarcticum]|uniref:Uncharacterized protein n=1 Tax=Trichocladium antarcticum TaxID=1450529 RepID=A0AAN6UTJ6_9PEZI|nr:hypothetical protein BT67DRAFT_8088 [Trichocladium antarcticum]
MGNHLSSLTALLPGPPAPTPVTIRGIRFPADGSPPHLLPLTTTARGVAGGPDASFGHVPDLRAWWGTKRAWRWRDVETFRLERQPLPRCDGLYVLFYSFDLDALPENVSFPQAVYGRERYFAGDAFAVKLKGDELNSAVGEDGWAVWDDVPAEILSLPVMRMGPLRGEGLRSG